MKQINLSLSRKPQIVQASVPLINQLQVLAVTEADAQVMASASSNGATVYLYVSLSATPPTEADMISGAGAEWFGSFVMSSAPSGMSGPSGLAPGTAYYLYALAEQNGEHSAFQSVSFATDVPDTVAPTLSEADFTVNDETNVDLAVTTNENNGDLYVVVTTTQATPTAAQMRLGQDSTGVAAGYSNGGQAVSEAGVQLISANDLTQAAYYAYFMQDDRMGNTSSVLEAGPFTPSDVTIPIVSSVEIVTTGTTTALLTFNTDTDEGDAFFIVQPAGEAAPTLAQIKAGAVGTVQGQQAVSAAGPQSAEITGLSEAVAYLAYVAQVDAAGNDSLVVAAFAEAITDSSFAQSWTQADIGIGFASFSTAGGQFDAEKTASGGFGQAYSDAFIDGSVSELITIQLVFGASTTVTSFDVSLSFTSNHRSTTVQIDPSGGGTFTAEVEITSGGGPYSVLLGTDQLGIVDVESVQRIASASGAVVFIGVGQSLNAGRGGTIVQSGGSDAIMATGGAHISSFNFWSSNQEHALNQADWASTVPFAEGGGGQSPLAGVANILTDYDDVLLHSAAIGARTLETLHNSYHQVSAAVERSVSLLKGEGYARSDISIMFSMKHGEANANSQTSQADYETLLTNYINRCRIAVRQALRDPSYVAKFHISFPIKQNQPDADRTIKKSILAVADTLPNVIIGEVYSVPAEADRVHPTVAGYVLMGERAAYQVEKNIAAMRCTSFSGVGTGWTATFNKPVVQDARYNWGANLNAAHSEEGLEVWDNGASAFIAITSLTYSGNDIAITLASAPIGTPELRIASQDTSGTLVGESGPPGDIHNPSHTGCAVRSTDAGWASPFDPTYTHYDWCIPQIVEAT